MRKCPICENKESKVFFVQKFAEGLNHSVAVCSKCDFVFVSNAPNQKFYNEYYKSMSKYELERDKNLHNEYAKLIGLYSQQSERILDIGCSTGHLLYLLKRRGFGNLHGIDPSDVCRKIAKEKYNINIQTTEIFSFHPKIKFNLVILAMVLEHIDKTRDLIRKVDSLVSKNGYVFISVPDAGNFYRDVEEPFGEFSTEHINFFSSEYLFKLMRGYECLFLKSDGNNILSLWRKGGNLRKSIKKYINQSSLKQRRIVKMINNLPNRILVWGAGSLTRRLLQGTNLNKKIVKLIDSDKKLWERKIANIEVISPTELKKYKEPILISSFRFKDEILGYIKKRRLPNKIITF